MAVGQAGDALHTMLVLYPYQANLLKDLDQGQGLSPAPHHRFGSLGHQTDGCYHRSFSGGHEETSVAETVGDQREKPFFLLP